MFLALIVAAAATQADSGVDAGPVGATANDLADNPFAGDLFEREFLVGDLGGVRSHLADRGIRVEGSYIADYSDVFDGGLVEGGTAFRDLWEVGIAIETEPLFGLAGGEFFISMVSQNGEDGSESVGDIQAFSNIDERDFTALYELWYQQWLFDERLRVKIGKVDANGEFAFVDFGGEFINSSAGFSPTIQAFPSYPDPATSVNVFVYPNDQLYVGFGLYDGAAQEGITVGTRGPSTFFGDPADLFLIAEAGVTHELGGLPGRVGLGVWHHTGTFDRFDGGTEDGTSGFYVVADQTLWREAPGDEGNEQGIGAFFQYGFADDAVSEIAHHVGVGVQWVGALPGRDDDVMGLMASPVWLSDEAGAGFTEDAEVAFELFYKVQLTPWAAVKPDLQYIINPGGDETIEDALVGTIRVELTF